MRSKSGVIGILLALAVVAGAAYWLRARDQLPAAAVQTSTPGAEGAPSPATREASARDFAAARRAPRSTAPLPSLDAPLRSILRELTDRAKAGDARAMCRLAAEYQYCSELQARMRMIETGVARAQSGQDEGPGQGFGQRRGGGAPSAERMAAAFEDVNARYEHCEGVTLASSADVARQMRGAATAGHPQASSYYVSGEIFRTRDTLENLSELSYYRDNAETLARAAVADGDLTAAWALANAYAADPADMRRPLLSQAVDPAPGKGLALLYALRTATGSASGNPDAARMAARLQQRIATLEQQLPQAEVSRARSEPSPLGAGSASPRQVDALSQTMRSRGGAGGWGGGGAGGLDRQLCD